MGRRHREQIDKVQVAMTIPSIRSADFGPGHELRQRPNPSGV